jgi:phage tail sheath protein FI
MPGVAWKGSNKPIIEAAIAQCQRLDDRLVMVDIPAGLRLKSAARAQQLKLPVTPHAVVYYPWARIHNPDFSSSGDQRVPRSLLTSPAALAAALWAETDRNRGVWKAPAGSHATLAGVHRLQYAVDSTSQALLNPLDINCLRRMTGLGTAIWGARTRAGQAAREWQYIPVKRTAQYIQSSVDRGITWTTFQANDSQLWSALRTAVDAFMLDLFRQGALQGNSQREAWYVRCGLGETMTQADVNRGRVIVEIGFAPLKPAEFVILRVGGKTAT